MNSIYEHIYSICMYTYTPTGRITELWKFCGKGDGIKKIVFSKNFLLPVIKQIRKWLSFWRTTLGFNCVLQVKYILGKGPSIHCIWSCNRVSDSVFDVSQLATFWGLALCPTCGPQGLLLQQWWEFHTTQAPAWRAGTTALPLFLTIT